MFQSVSERSTYHQICNVYIYIYIRPSRLSATQFTEKRHLAMSIRTRSLEPGCMPSNEYHRISTLCVSPRDTYETLRDISPCYVQGRPTFIAILRDITRHRGDYIPVRPTRHLRDTHCSLLFSPRGLCLTPLLFSIGYPTEAPVGQARSLHAVCRSQQ